MNARQMPYRCIVKFDAAILNINRFYAGKPLSVQRKAYKQ
jgi:hypothetical protein